MNSTDCYYSENSEKLEDKKITLHGKNNQELSLSEIYRRLKETGVEVTLDHKIVLYHATSGKYLSKILKDGVLKPASETGSRIYRNYGEEDGEKMDKVYLAKLGANALNAVGRNHSGTTYVLKVFIDLSQIGNLRIDEDCYGANNFIESLENVKGVCSYLGQISDFEIVKKNEFDFCYKNIGYAKFLCKYHNYYNDLLILKAIKNYLTSGEIYLTYNENFSFEKTPVVLRNHDDLLNFFNYLQKYRCKIHNCKKFEEKFTLKYNSKILAILSEKGYEYLIKNIDKLIVEIENEMQKYSPKRIVDKYASKYDIKIEEILAEKGLQIPKIVRNNLDDVLSCNLNGQTQVNSIGSSMLNYWLLTMEEYFKSNRKTHFIN